MQNNKPPILFSDYFDVNQEHLDEYGAFNISLVADLPLFIDPFLLFNSNKEEYQQLHEEIIDYLRFLKDKSVAGEIDKGLLEAWYQFKEVHQNWFGFSTVGNKGSALGRDFAHALNDNFHRLFANYGDEKITKGSHLEKLCLIKDGVGKDNISDFTTNLIKHYLLEYTQEFAKKYIDPRHCRLFRVRKVRFNFHTESWEDGSYLLPMYMDDFVLLTPKDLLTKDNTWINRADLVEDFHFLPNSIANEQLRSQINNYFKSVLPKKAKKKEEAEAIRKTILQFPVLIDYFIKHKEDHGEVAKSISAQKVSYSENLYVGQFNELAKLLASRTNFYKTAADSYKDALERVKYLKQVIENNDGYKLFYDKKGKPIQREEDLKVAYRLTWYGSKFDYNTEVNNGRGPVDVKISLGSKDTSLVELKLAKNTQLKRNLNNQLEVYKKANSTSKEIKAILYFSASELKKIQNILKDLGLEGKENIILIDARKDNKPSASKA